MKKIIFSLIISFLFAVNLIAQIPQYYNANSGGIGNSLPFGSLAVSGFMTQWLIGPGEYILPTPAPSGNITKLYIWMSTSGSGTYTKLTIKMGQTAVTTLPPGVIYTGPMDTVYYNLSAALTSTANTWMVITLTRPFTYNPAQSLVIQVSHCGFTGGGFNIWQTAGTTGVMRRNNIQGTPSCVFTYSSQDTRILQNGIDISAAPSVNRALKLPTPGVNTHYVMIPHQSGMIGLTAITIEGWMKISGFTTNNTLLNKGASSFDYQLGVTTGRTVAFRAQGTIVIATSIIMPVDTWTHLAVTYDGATCKFYRNGVLAQTETAPGALGNSMNEMRIGRGSADPGSGLIDEVRLWNVIRTEAQISADMCNKWVPNNSTGLKGKWHFDSTYTDSVSGWHGTPTTSSVTFDTVTWCPIVGIEQISTTVPKEFSLEQNYPNPFNPATTIKFSIPKEGYVEMKLFDVMGREVATLVSDPYRAGIYSVEFDASGLASGVYFYKITSGDFTATKKMVLIK